MDFDELVAAETLLRAHWRNVVVLVLAKRGRSTFGILHQAIRAFAPSEITERKLTRVLSQLKDDGLIRQRRGASGVPQWELTSAGTQHAAVLRGLGRAASPDHAAGPDQ